MNEITVDGVVYRKAEPTSGRAVVVVDRGWIFAGDVHEESNRLYLTNAVWVFRWESVGFAEVIANSAHADIRPIADLDIPLASEVFRIPVPSDWGL